MKRTPDEIMELMDKFLDEYEEADKKYQDGQDRKHWDETFGERLGAYSDKLKTLNGDDFDIIDAARSEYKDSYSDFNEDEYVNKLEENIKATLARIWPEATPEKVEEVVSEASEEAKEETEEESNSEEESTPEAETEITVETKPEEEDETEPETDPVDDDYKELLKYKESMPKRGE